MPSHVRTGLIASFFVITASLGLCSLFPPAIFLGWVAYLCIAAVPMMLVGGFLWRADPPVWLGRLRQPGKGLALCAITLLSTGPAAAFLYWLPGRGAGPTPSLVMASIVTVVAAFWVIVAWRCWPLTMIFSDKTRLGLAAWAASFALGYAVFALLFSGPSSLVFLVTTSAVISAFAKSFGAWPIKTASPPRFALLASLYILVLSALWMAIGVVGFGLDPIDFMVEWPVALIFGTFLVTNMTGFRLCAEMNQPAKGFCLLGVAMSVGILLFQFYKILAPLLAGAPLEHHPLDLWVATALLSVTFPLVIVAANFFELWPFE